MKYQTAISAILLLFLATPKIATGDNPHCNSQHGITLQIPGSGVPHGPVPALAYKIQIGQKSLVFSGDQNGSSEAFTRFARDANVLVMHMPVPESIRGTGKKLHAPPTIIGKIAAETGMGQLVLSHLMALSLGKMEDNLKQVRAHYQGPVMVAHDLDCIGT